MRAAVPVVVVARGDGAAEQVGRLAVRVHQQLRALSDWACVLPGAVRLPPVRIELPFAVEHAVVQHVPVPSVVHPHELADPQRGTNNKIAEPCMPDL